MHTPLYVVATSLVAIVLLVVLIAKFKFHPFLSLVICSVGLGLVNFLGPTATSTQITNGFGSTLGVTGMIIALGTVIGAFLVQSGGADQIAESLVGNRRGIWLSLAIGLAAVVIGLPNLFEVTFVLLVPLAFTMAARAKVNPIAVGIPMAAGLMTSHGLLPPGPATVIGANAYNANLGTTTIYGLIICIPVLLSGAWLFPWLIKRWNIQAKFENSAMADFHADHDTARRPGLFWSWLVILLPPILIIIGTYATHLFPKKSFGAGVISFMANPMLTMLFSALCSMFLLGYRSGIRGAEALDIMKKYFVPIINMMLIIGAGGGLKNILSAVGLSKIVANAVTGMHLSPILFAWLCAVLFRLALGSGTVAVTASSAIVAPLIAADPSTNAPLMVLATATGAMFFSHVSDGAFWIFKEYFGLTVPETFKTWSLLVTVQSIVGLICLLILGIFV